MKQILADTFITFVVLMLLAYLSPLILIFAIVCMVRSAKLKGDIVG